MSKEKEVKKDPQKAKDLVLSIILWTLGGVAVLIILLWDYIFVNIPFRETVLLASISFVWLSAGTGTRTIGKRAS